MPRAIGDSCSPPRESPLLLAATFAAYQPVAPLGADAPPTVFSAQRATAILRDLVGNGVPHPLGSPAAAQLRDAIVDRFSALGYAPELQSGFVCNDYGVCGNPVNIVVPLAGSPGEQNAVLLAAHYDSVPAGPGASDDGAAVASLLEIARILKARPAPRHPIILLITDGEEAGLLGALLFVREHPLVEGGEGRGQFGRARNLGAQSHVRDRRGQYLAHAFVRIGNRAAHDQLALLRGVPAAAERHRFHRVQARGLSGFQFRLHRQCRPLPHTARQRGQCRRERHSTPGREWAGGADGARQCAELGRACGGIGFFRRLLADSHRLALRTHATRRVLALMLLVAEAAILLRGGAVTGRQILRGWVGIALRSRLGSGAVRRLAGAAHRGSQSTGTGRRIVGFAAPAHECRRRGDRRCSPRAP